MNIVVARDIEELAEKAAARILEAAREAIGDHGNFTIALAGGSTPRPLYTLLAKSDADWKKWIFFFGDERDVPADDEQSNLRMAKETLFHAIPPEHRSVVAWPTGSGERASVAEAYAERLRRHFGSDSLVVPRFDLILLGMGSDGHTASLFPGTAALNETERLAVSNFVPKLNVWRYTLTFPVINNASRIILLVSGSDKAATLRNVIRGERRIEELPAQGIAPHHGELLWIVDAAAAELLTR